MERRRVISINLDSGPYSSFIERVIALGRVKTSSYVCVANVHMLVAAYHDSTFAGIVNGADLVTPDGMPLAKSMRLLYGLNQDRVAGMDLVPDLLAAAGREELSIFLYGSTHEVLSKVASRIVTEHPGARVVGCYCPPFRQLTHQEALEEAAVINSSGAHIVLVALGCPKQERWMAFNKSRIDAVMVGIGGALPVYAGMQKRAPRIMQQLSLEWLYRLYQEPRRLMRRYLVTNTTFLLLLAREFLVCGVLPRKQADTLGEHK